VATTLEGILSWVSLAIKFLLLLFTCRYFIDFIFTSDFSIPTPKVREARFLFTSTVADANVYSSKASKEESSFNKVYYSALFRS
jgi:hypothetical protein